MPPIDRPDPRPILVNVLGAGWLLVCFFAVLNAGVLLVQQVTTGGLDPDSARILALAEQEPELVMPEQVEEIQRRQALADLSRRFAWPLLAIGGLGFAAAVHFLRRGRHARKLLVAVGVAALATSVAHAYITTRAALEPLYEIGGDPTIAQAFWITAVINVLLQSLPVLLGMGLLAHGAVRRYCCAAPLSAPAA